jgi:dihydroorotate dehydrogenase electron transfer subunit
VRYFQAKISENRVLGGGYFVLQLVGCESLASAQPGQFVMIRGAWGRDPLLPRAFSLMSVGPGGRAEILAKTVGRGTALLERALPGAEIDILGPLGTSFPEPSADTVDLLVAGGVGLPPMFMQAALAAERGRVDRSEMIYGGRGAPDLVLLREMETMGLALFLTTEDGAVGDKGLVTRALEARLAHHRGKSLRVMGCGPNGMLWAIARLARDQNIPCFISLEEQMACGIGVCLGCAIPARTRPYRYVCSNGPVFDAADVLDVDQKPPVAPAACPA